MSGTDRIKQLAGIMDLPGFPKSAGMRVVSVEPGKGAGKKLLFLLNHTTTPKTVRVPAGKRELLTGQSTGDTLDLGILGVAVLEM